MGTGLDVSGNSSLTSFSVPALFSVGGLGFNNNPSYRASAVDAIAAQVGLAPGTYANNGNADCLAAQSPS